MNERDLFLAALKKPDATERSAFLAAACDGDSKLRQGVERLLREHEQLGSYLESPAVPEGGTVDEPLSERPGTLIGPYKLLEQIGEGGMGLVFAAEQQQPVCRKVALKVIKPGMDSRQVIARFEAERQALALMDHPHIAKVHDGGTTDSGRPYFVMELVKGVPITEYCDRHRLTTRQRLGLFVHVCQAVRHAHQKGIIHRDLKPSNVLVTLHDTVAVPKVIDFGIAKAVGQQLTDKTLVTGFAQMIGTPLYMSPEQAGLSGLDVDTRTDVYALGVLLYELLTGTTPFEKERLRQASYDEVLRIIREEEAPKPSTCISTLGQAATTVAEQRQIDPKRLSRLLRGELDWIVLKALEKDRDRRYESTSALAADVQRYLNNESVQACPPSAGYLLKKFARRNKGRLVVACVLAVFAILVARLSWHAHDWQLRRAEAEGRVIEALAAAEPKLRAGNPHDMELISARGKAEAQLASGVVREELQQQVKQLLADWAMLAAIERIRLDQTATDKNNNTFDWAGTDPAYARAFRDYGIDVEALAVPEAAAQIRQRTIGLHLAGALDDWARVRRLADRADWKQLLEVAKEADPDRWRCAYRDARISGTREDLEKLVAAAPIPELAPTTLALFGRDLRDTGHVLLALDVLRKGQRLHPDDFWINGLLAGCLRLAPPPHRKLEEAIGYCRIMVALRPQSAETHMNLGLALAENGQQEEALASFQEAGRLRPDYSFAHYFRGVELMKQDLFDEAIACFRLAIHLKPEFFVFHMYLGIALAKNDQLDEAIASHQEAIRLRPNEAVCHFRLGNARRMNGDLDGAIACWRQALQLNKNDTSSLNNLGLALKDKGQLDEAIAFRRRLLELDNKDLYSYNELGWMLAKNGQFDEAIGAYQKAIQLKPDLAPCLNNLASLLADSPDLCLRDPAQAVELAKKAVELAPYNSAPWSILGVARYRTGEWQGAIEAFEKSNQIAGRRGGFFLAMAYWQLGNTEKAGQCFYQAVEGMDENKPKDEDSRRNRAEAAALLEIKDEPAGKKD
jgi:serine/threonine protein kinase/Flp pilus assembly protein TadD